MNADEGAAALFSHVGGRKNSSLLSKKEAF
jgi:hypothetical protein